MEIGDGDGLKPHTTIYNSEVDKIRESNKASYLKIQTMAETTKGTKHNFKMFISKEMD